MPNIETSLSIKLYDFNVYDGFVSRQSHDSDDGSYKFNNYKSSHEFVVQMFGITETGRTASVIVTDFCPFFYVKVGLDWNESIKNEFIQHLRRRVGSYYEDCIIDSTIVERHKLYGFDNNKLYKFILIKFTNTRALNKAKQIFYETIKVDGKEQRELIECGYKYNGTNVELYEAQIPPLLKLFHIKSISPSGWILLDKRYTQKIVNKKTSLQYELQINYDKIVAKNEKETPVKYNILSYDIEASSSHGDFPVAKKDYKKLAIDILTYYNNLDDEERDIFSQESLLELIKSAFGYCKINGINLVYTKREHYSLVEIEEQFSKIMQHNIKTVKYENNESSDDNQEDEESSSNEEEEPSLNENKNNDVSVFVKYKKKIITKWNKNGTLVDLIKDSKAKYETKMRHINKLFKKYFPQLEGDTITFIGLSYIYYGETQPYKRVLIVKGGCIPPPEYDISTTKIISVSSEKDILLRFTKNVQKNKPHFVIGYNINGFDFDFMFKRSCELDCRDDFLKLSFNQDEICISRDWKTQRYDIEKSKILLASGEYNLKYIKMPGRIIIDLYNVFRREHQLTSYKLDYTSSYFISDDVNKYENLENGFTKIYSKNLSGLTQECYVKFEEISYSINSYKKGKKFKVCSIDNIEASFVIESNEQFDIDNYKIRWGLAKDDVGPQQIFKLANGSDSDRWIVGKYCLADCDNVIALLLKNDIITGYIEMARLCSVPLSFLFNRGQGIKLTSYVSKKCQEKNTLMPVLKKQLDDSGYEGAHVFTPKTGLYLKEPVSCVDYSSLYPSSIISENISHDSKVWTKTYNLENELLEVWGETDKDGVFIYDNLEGFKYVDITYDTYEYIRKTEKSAATKQITGYKVCRYAQFKYGKKAILPSILEELLLARKTTRKLIPQQTDEFMKKVLDARQLSIKVTANSVYGQCGAKTGTFYEKDVAASTTAVGRNLLFYAKDIIEKCYNERTVSLKSGRLVKTRAECVYGDTDSIFFKFNLRDTNDNPIENKEALEITIELAQEAGALATKFLKKPHDLEYEKTFWPFCLLSKKRYDGMLYEFNPDKAKLKSMGNVLKRRDNAPIVKDIYGGVIGILMKDKNLNKAIEWTRECLDKIVKKEYPIEKLVISKSLRGNYKNPKQIAHKVLADRIALRVPGNEPGPGDRIDYAYIINPDKKALQGEKIETVDFICEKGLKLDFNHYITNQIMKPLQQLYALELENIVDFKKQRGVTLQSWKREVDKLSEKWPDREKFNKKYEELRMKQIKLIIFEDYLKMLKN